MSNVVQEPPAGQAAAPAATAAPQSPPAAQAEDRKNSRSYTLFEEARSDTWTKLGDVEADTQEAALETLGEQKLKSGQRFVAVPTRYFRPVKPDIKTVTTISFG